MSNKATPDYPPKPAGTIDEPYDPLQYFISIFDGRTGEAKKEKKRAETIEERLKERIIEGDRKDMDADLEEGDEDLSAAHHYQ